MATWSPRPLHRFPFQPPDPPLSSQSFLSILHRFCSVSHLSDSLSTLSLARLSLQLFSSLSSWDVLTLLLSLIWLSLRHRVFLALAPYALSQSSTIFVSDLPYLAVSPLSLLLGPRVNLPATLSAIGSLVTLLKLLVSSRDVLSQTPSPLLCLDLTATSSYRDVHPVVRPRDPGDLSRNLHPSGAMSLHLRLPTFSSPRLLIGSHPLPPSLRPLSSASSLSEVRSISLSDRQTSLKSFSSSHHDLISSAALRDPVLFSRISDSRKSRISSCICRTHPLARPRPNRRRSVMLLTPVNLAVRVCVRLIVLLPYPSVHPSLSSSVLPACSEPDAVRIQSCAAQNSSTLQDDFDEPFRVAIAIVSIDSIQLLLNDVSLSLSIPRRKTHQSPRNPQNRAILSSSLAAHVLEEGVVRVIGDSRLQTSYCIQIGAYMPAPLDALAGHEDPNIMHVTLSAETHLECSYDSVLVYALCIPCALYSLCYLNAHRHLSRTLYAHKQCTLPYARHLLIVSEFISSLSS
ncbi:hypothetical protein C7M84_017950 [Penaeus vannamei]|uniref:Uncharacterized protein n=1 Tax=Penaeus vannamei TaxID=6689 RepID=A0A3R7PZ59_PENVA|nr:hypothetical protein C7M84_017950 [Penaeus vannamei]